ncbi:Far upstream element-binding protein 1 [Aphelenchoides besseyi]|nr:Far upstream element-binding protein 1 [Aphelenchoides besseyi]KAI6236716.1 Far upstream element-binding protein 1 [Aphelenchoides besseyi]
MQSGVLEASSIVEEEIYVPRHSVGMIIGRQGKMIDEISQKTSTHIQFKPDTDTTTPERCAVIQGTAQQIKRATNLIWDLVKRSANHQPSEVGMLHVPRSKAGLLIGRSGESIRSISEKSKANIKTSPELQMSKNEQVFVIRGTPKQIHHAQHLMRIRIGEIPEDTELPDYTHSWIEYYRQMGRPDLAESVKKHSEMMKPFI